MNKIFLTLLLLLAPFTANSLDSNKTITLRADEWYPFNGNPASELPGYMIEIAQRAFQDNGYQLDYQVLPWERSLEEVANGSIDCVVGAYPTEAPDFIFHQFSLGKNDTGFFGLKSQQGWKHNQPGALMNKRIGVIGGYDYGSYIDDHVAAYKDTDKVHVSKGDDALDRNIKMLLSGRIDILVESTVVFNYKLKNSIGKERIILIDRDYQFDNIFIGCSPINPERSRKIVKLIDDTILRLRKSGELDSILEKYGLNDWHEPTTTDSAPGGDRR